MYARSLLLLALVSEVLSPGAFAQSHQNWVTSWAASVQGPYPSGNASAQPDLRFAFPSPETGARDQTFRLIIQPDIWGVQTRLRLSNVFGSRPVAFDGIFVGLQLSGATLVAGTNTQVLFGRKSSVTVPPGESRWSDPVTLPFVSDRTAAILSGRKLAISIHVSGESGPMTWHAKALTTSYLSKPASGATSESPNEAAFPFSTTSWYFLDAVDILAPAGTHTIVALGDSITDGTASTLNGDDRWPNILSRRLHGKFDNRFAVVNAGIGGNRVAGPPEYSPQKPFSGGPSALERLDRDVLSLSGVSGVIWLEGINDFSTNANTPVEAVKAAMREAVKRIRTRLPDVVVIGATVTSALGSANGTPEQDAKRRALNEFILTGGLFDGVADFDKITVDPATGELRPEFVPDSTTGGRGDKLHPNRAGYLAMGMAIDLNLFLPKADSSRPR